MIHSKSNSGANEHANLCLMTNIDKEVYHITKSIPSFTSDEYSSSNDDDDIF